MRRTIVHRILGVLLTALFLGHYAGATLFVHTHTTADGSVTHSHPYIPSSGHGHSAAGFAAINALTHLCFVVTAVAWAAVLRVQRAPLWVEKVAVVCAAPIEWSPLRGPPAVC